MSTMPTNGRRILRTAVECGAVDGTFIISGIATDSAVVDGLLHNTVSCSCDVAAK